ncbi:MAG: alpha-galactosidase [SAR324 cluster bacterium]|nr:alpha-galactosidase [SAR324 cluster bacterium]
MGLKIVIIGAGSLVFSSRLTADLLTYSALNEAHIALVDLDPDRLNYAGRIVERMLVEGKYCQATYSMTIDRREALQGADYVISSILVGGYDAIAAEIDIPMKYGVDQAIGDTLTPGGIMRCLRTLPHQIGIARDILEICPDATLLNYTNPMAMLCWGMYKSLPEIKLVGLCHSVQGTTEEWAKRLGIDIRNINFECAGINHQAWITRFQKDGQDLLPQIRNLAEDPKIWLGDSSRMEYVKHFGFPVTEASGHNSEYSGWFRKTPELVQQYCPGGSWNGASGFIKTLYNRPDWRETMEKMARWEKPVDLKRSFEYGSQIINAMEGGEPVIVHGNVRNAQLIENLPEDCCVEVPCFVDKNGIQALKVGKLPLHLAAINRNQINVQELAVEATLQQDLEMVFQAMCLDPLTASILTLDQIRAMTIELVEAHRPYIPQFEGKTLVSKPVLIGSFSQEVEVHHDPGEKRS